MLPGGGNFQLENCEGLQAFIHAIALPKVIANLVCLDYTILFHNHSLRIYVAPSRSECAGSKKYVKCRTYCCEGASWTNQSPPGQKYSDPPAVALCVQQAVTNQLIDMERLVCGYLIRI